MVPLLLKSYEGLIGIKYTEEKVFMTSPNMEVLTVPLLGRQTISLRQQMHYAEHDPCLVAQPFSSQTPWLSVIQYPYAYGYASAIPWHLPVEQEFEPIDGHKLAENPLGLIPDHYTTELNRYFLALNATASTHRPSIASQSSEPVYKKRMNDYSSRLRYLLTKLASPLLFDEAIHCWVTAQRNLLELEALHLWFSEVQPSFDTPTIGKIPPLRNVVGALTDRGDLAEKLYRLRPCNTPHPIVFEGHLADTRRYQKMAEYSWAQAFPSSIWGSDKLLLDVTFEGSSVSTHAPPLSPLSTPDPSLPSSSATSAGPSSPSHGPSRSASRSSRTKPYSVPVKKAKQEVRNKFLFVDSPLAPKPITPWQQAAEIIGSRFNHSQAGRPNINRGYVLPEPALFLTQKDHGTTQSFFATYLRTRQALLYRITKLGAYESLKTATQWRTLLSIGRHAEGRQNSRAADNRRTMREIINAVNSDGQSGLNIDMDNLQAVVPSWKGRQYPTDIPADICQQVLLEISCISFSEELLMANWFFYEVSDEIEEGEDELAATSRQDRNMKVLSAVPGLMNAGEMGFGSQDLLLRRKSLQGLNNIMSGWSRTARMSTVSSSIVSRLQESAALTSAELEDIEFHLAYHYIISFADFFKRAPVLPTIL
ncbi:hypothetical protein C8R42DRAFT_640173 [Lentinula raphanica]|nr:hypothetical protein C8R42DRAFT_640173 [Lentinula raphanica]